MIVWKTLKELNKGDRVLLKNGWVADLMDNKRNGQTRMAKVYGFETEIGSVYNSDISMYEENGRWVPITVTVAEAAKYAKLEAMRKAMGF